MEDLRIRGRNKGKSASDIRGEIAESAVYEYFKNRGHEIKNVAGINVQHDLEVVGIGRVQVKSVHIKVEHPGTVKARKVFAVTLGSCKRGVYAVDAFDVLALVWTPKDKHYVVLLPAKQLVSQRDTRRMASTIRMPLTRFRNMMEPVVKSELALLW